MNAATSAWEALNGQPGRRKRRGDSEYPTDPVRKHSYDIRDRRAQPWRAIGNGSLPFGRAFTAALTRTVTWLYEKQYDEGYCGPDRLQRSHLRVLPAILGKLDFATGRLDPSWEEIASKARCRRGVVDRALAAFHEIGVIHTVRRTVRVAGAEGERRPQVAQTSDAFYFDCKERMSADVFATFWRCLLEELAKHGKWLKQQARRILNTFNPNATPSPRESKVPGLVKRAMRSEPADRPNPPRRTPVQGAQGRPSNLPAEQHGSALKTLPGAAQDALARMASAFGLDLEEVMKASPE